jgi:hypothetical protein
MNNAPTGQVIKAKTNKPDNEQRDDAKRYLKYYMASRHYISMEYNAATSSMDGTREERVKDSMLGGKGPVKSHSVPPSAPAPLGAAGSRQRPL